MRCCAPSFNVKTDVDFIMAVAWVLACLRERGSYPVLVLSGEQGSAKSTFAAILRALIDPNSAALRALPREDRDLFIAASNSHLLCFDNVSGLPAWISDTLCRLATGGGFAVRQFESNHSRVPVSAPTCGSIKEFSGTAFAAEEPCATRRGVVVEENGLLLHFCVECGCFGRFGVGVSVRRGRIGRWYCREHRPRPG